MMNLDAAEVDLLRLAPMAWTRAEMPSILAHVTRHLAADDPRRARVESIAERALEQELTPYDRDTVVAAAHAASSEQRRGVLRLRSLRNVLVVPIVLLTIGALAFMFVGLADPHAIPLCFQPEGKVVCPTGETTVGAKTSIGDVDDLIRNTAAPFDIALIEMVGLIAAAVAAATALRGLRGTSGAYDFPLILAVLKLPTGALTAVLGLLLMRAQFVPGLSALDSSAQIIAWAVILGYSQQVFTRLVDKSAREVLQESVTSPAPPAQGAAPRPPVPVPPSPQASAVALTPSRPPNQAA